MKKTQWLNIFKALKEKGVVCSPRGEKILEIEDYQVSFDINNVICPFKERKLSLSYNFTELSWYLSGDRNDTRMEEVALFWKSVKNENKPYYHSNYGYYWFTEKQFENIINILCKDKDSRQACIAMNRVDVVMSDSKDKICTNAIMFRIRDNKLNMSVQMRSNCVITGLGIDSHMFSILWQMVFLKLKDSYRELELGTYTHNASSLHIYEKHWSIMDDIIDSNGSNISDKTPPLIIREEVDFLINNLSLIEKDIRKLKRAPKYIPENYLFSKFAIDEICKRWGIKV